VFVVGGGKEKGGGGDKQVKLKGNEVAWGMYFWMNLQVSTTGT